VRRGNSLTKPINSYTEDDQVQIVATNPPFGGSEQQSVLSNFPTAYRLTETADLFMTVIHTSLRTGGRAAVIYPASPPPSDGKKRNLRKRLVEECNLHTIVQLPNSTFKPYATISTNILFFEKGPQTEHLWFYQHTVPDGQKHYSKSKPIKSEHLNGVREWWFDRQESEIAWRVSIEEIENSNYNIFNWKNPNIPEETFEDADILLNRYAEQDSSVIHSKTSLVNVLQNCIDATKPKDEHS
jgi:type I restriction enzyme M protein